MTLRAVACCAVLNCMPMTTAHGLAFYLAVPVYTHFVIAFLIRICTFYMFRLLFFLKLTFACGQ